MANHKLYYPGDKVENKYGTLTYIEDTEYRNGSTGNIIGIWKCWCPKETIFQTVNVYVRKQATQSCGCLQVLFIESRLRNEETVYLGVLWARIKNHCFDINESSYHNYGGRGITMQEDWINDYEKFEKDVLGKVGHRPTDKHIFDRIDNNGNYTINNVRWVTYTESARNRRSNHLVVIDGEEKTVAELAEIKNIKRSTIYDRLAVGKEGDELFAPVRAYNENTTLINIWTSMNNRCSCPENYRYHRYGGRGIKIHHAWKDDFATFEKDIVELIGARPLGTQLDRIDNDGNYEPGNIRWATRFEQANNKSNNVFVTINNKTQTIMEWSRETGVAYGTVHRRLEEGWDGDDLILQEDQRTISKNIVDLVREEYLMGRSMWDISKEYSVNRRTVINIIRGRSAYSYLENIYDDRQEDEKGNHINRIDFVNYSYLANIRNNYKKNNEVVFHQSWLDSYDQFCDDVLEEIGHRPSDKHSFCRIAHQGNFEPGNICWLDKIEMNNGREHNIKTTINGVTKFDHQWCAENNISYSLFRSRKLSGWSDDELFLPLSYIRQTKEVVEEIRKEYLAGRDIEDLSKSFIVAERALIKMLRGKDQFDYCDDIYRKPERKINLIKETEINGRKYIRKGSVTQIFIKINNVEHTLDEWAEISGLDYQTVYGRLRVGKTGEDLIKPKGAKNPNTFKSILKGIKSWCNNPNNKKYINYGSKGIKIYSKWQASDYKTFKNDVIAEIGDSPSDKHYFARIDVSKDFEPNNIRWATKSEMKDNLI